MGDTAPRDIVGTERATKGKPNAQARVLEPLRVGLQKMSVTLPSVSALALYDAGNVCLPQSDNNPCLHGIITWDDSHDP